MNCLEHSICISLGHSSNHDKLKVKNIVREKLICIFKHQTLCSTYPFVSLLWIRYRENAEVTSAQWEFFHLLKKKHKADFFRKKLLKENCTCGIISLSLLQTATVNKGQIISKSNYLAVNSSKKWMNSFYYYAMCFGSFLEEIEGTKKTFQN